MHLPVHILGILVTESVLGESPLGFAILADGKAMLHVGSRRPTLPGDTIIEVRVVALYYRIVTSLAKREIGMVEQVY